MVVLELEGILVPRNLGIVVLWLVGISNDDLFTRDVICWCYFQWDYLTRSFWWNTLPAVMRTFSLLRNSSVVFIVLNNRGHAWCSCTVELITKYMLVTAIKWCSVEVYLLSSCFSQTSGTHEFFVWISKIILAVVSHFSSSRFRKSLSGLFECALRHIGSKWRVITASLSLESILIISKALHDHRSLLSWRTPCSALARWSSAVFKLFTLIVFTMFDKIFEYIGVKVE